MADQGGFEPPIFGFLLIKTGDRRLFQTRLLVQHDINFVIYI